MNALNIYLTRIFKNIPDDVICNILKYTNIVYIKEKRLFIGKINNINRKYCLLNTIPKPTITTLIRTWEYDLNEIHNSIINIDLINYYCKLGFKFKKRVTEDELNRWGYRNVILTYYDVIFGKYIEEVNDVYEPYYKPKEYILNVNMIKTRVKYRTHINKVVDKDGWITEEKIIIPIYEKIPFKIVKAVSLDNINTGYNQKANMVKYAIINNNENIGHKIPAPL